MAYPSFYRQAAALILLIGASAGCGRSALTPPASAAAPDLVQASPTPAGTPATPAPLPPATGLTAYAFPESIDPAQHYLFYLHGRIIEEQGLPAVSPEHGEYEYEAILEKLSGYGLRVISEARPKNTDPVTYAEKIAGQVRALLKGGVPAGNITVVGASQGAGIAILTSYDLANQGINYVLLASCDADTIAQLKQNGVRLYGNVLSIYDSGDSLAGPCGELFAFSEGKISRHKEVVLHIGSGHGILYRALDEWVAPTVKWAGGK